jgi:hypothetical protein
MAWSNDRQLDAAQARSHDTLKTEMRALAAHQDPESGHVIIDLLDGSLDSARGCTLYRKATSPAKKRRGAPIAPRAVTEKQWRPGCGLNEAANPMPPAEDTMPTLGLGVCHDASILAHISPNHRSDFDPAVARQKRELALPQPFTQ